MSLLRIRELVRKEFLQLFRDKRNRPLLIITPMVQLILFGYVVTTDVRLINVAILDQAKTPESRLLIDTLNGNKTFRITHGVDSSEQLDDLLVRREVDIGIHIPPEFSSDIRRKKTAALQVLVDGSMSSMASVRIAHTVAFLDILNSRLINELYALRMEYGKIDARIRTWYNPNLNSQYFYVPAIVAFLIMLLTLLFTSMAIIREKESGTMEQLIVTPLKPAEFILGKTIPFILIAQAQMILVTLFAKFWFGVPFAGSAALLLGATCLFLLSTLGIGLFISTVSQTQQQAMMTTFFFMLPFFMFSGFVFPIINMPRVVQWLTYLNPLRYMLVIIRGIFLKGSGMEILWPQFAALALIGVVVFTGATKRVRKRLD